MNCPKCGKEINRQEYYDIIYSGKEEIFCTSCKTKIGYIKNI